MTIMRAPKNEPTGTSGQSYVKAKFEELGWGAVLNPEHDLGTDLWLMARDARRFDLGVLVGAQVKNGESWFDEPNVEDGLTVGWWFREDSQHFDYWLTHTVPHIIVLRDPGSGTAYWVQVTEENTVSTGKGRKILVPSQSIVNADHLDDLLEVAVSQRPLPEWEGSAWQPGRPIPESSLLRYALITPRLVAPHPNKTPESAGPVQGVALLAQLRLHDLTERWTKTQPLFEVEAARNAGDWTWDLYAALHGWLEDGSLDPLLPLVDTAPTPAARAASSVCASNALFEAGRVAEALDILGRATSTDDANPVDMAWLKAHKARCLAELGKLQGAKDLALAVVPIGQIAPHDPTARAVSGIAAEMIFYLGEWPRHGLADAIRARDNVASWWRSQVVVSGLAAGFDDDFEAWANDSSSGFRSENVTWARLRSAMLLAGFAADTPSWRYSASLLARRELMSTPDEERAIWALDILRLAGAKKEIRRAARRLLEFGPTPILSVVASTVDLRASTRTSMSADIELVKGASDVLAHEAADRHARWALEVLKDRSRFESRARSDYLDEDDIVSLLAALAIAVSDDVSDAIRRHIVALSPVGNELVARQYRRLIRTFSPHTWTHDQIEALARRSGEENSELARATEWLIARRNPDSRGKLIDRISRGDLGALSSYGNVADLPAKTVKEAISCLAIKVEERLAATRQGVFTHGDYDFLQALTLLNIWHPNEANWHPCVETLREPSSTPDDLASSIDLIGKLADRLPDEVRSLLRGPLEAVTTREPHKLISLFGSERDTRGAAAVAIAQLFPSEVSASSLRTLISGDAAQRAAAVRIVISTQDPASLNLLAAFTRDPDTNVRATVAEGLASWVANGIAETGSIELLEGLLQEPASRLGVYASRALKDRNGLASYEYLLDRLKNYPSAIVRARVANARANRDE